jgi:hypothetical protein
MRSRTAQHGHSPVLPLKSRGSAALHRPNGERSRNVSLEPQDPRHHAYAQRAWSDGPLVNGFARERPPVGRHRRGPAAAADIRWTRAFVDEILGTKILGTMKTLLAQLAPSFPSQENTATEALGYMLASSKIAAAALEGKLRTLAPQVPSSLSWKTQVSGDDDARPDLVGLDASEQPRVIVEVKFWAGLTEKQPIAYLKRLPPGGVLCVVGPAKRHSLLVGELVRRITEAKLGYSEVANVGDATVASVGEWTLVVVSWRALVDAIIASADDASERTLAENARQLQGLCDEQDSQAFLPLSGHELSSHGVYRRIIQFGELVDHVADKLGAGAKKGLRPIGGIGNYGRYLRLRGVGVLLLSDVRKWTKFASTPPWLSVRGPTFNEPGPSLDALASVAVRQPRKVFPAGDGFPAVALFLPAGVEKHVVVEDVLRQINEVGDAIAHLAPRSAEQAEAVPPTEPNDVEPS